MHTFDITTHTVTVTNPVSLDMSVLRCWIKGYTVEQTTGMHTPKQKFLNYYENTQSKFNSTRIHPLTLLRNHIANQYAFLELIEHWLHRPRNFMEQGTIVLPNDLKSYLIQKYYSFDENVMHELLGKRLNARSRKDLDDVSEKTKISIISCRRQFDNLKRIYKKVEDLKGNVIDNIEKKFLLAKQQAASYAHILFITENRLDTTKKKLNCLMLNDLLYCASVFVKMWTNSLYLEGIDDDLTQDLRDLKAVLTNDRTLLEQYKNPFNGR
ncbi:FIBP-domain-containing protein [Rozella allomycis CSF55]|uniref:Acidic fibroblast growth factor binding domain-containing protein n=1 Tax=Rozella allomycis (strain CSF55) TaxID=988480 RepID=A0A075AW56_ROZAC|nr:Acidic fibroblast growth factor binding domain-containing protein [Rozella allomycis CSF55]RKP21698.1 FIBP-domain-containing protein [Rozella allomycis CSF55]|eukprot:EPZ34538.1 Acidic fibroblast growth factor binding domain-containing protein [Rozella allomycis CSF55]